MSISRESWWISPKAGSFDRLNLREDEIDKPGEGEVHVEVKSFGLNFADVFAIVGLYSATPKGEFIPGLEFAGIVKEVGPGVDNVQIGQRVMGVCRFGGYTNHIVSRKDYVIPIPESWSFEEGAAYLVQVLTAYYGLIALGGIQQGETVLVHSAAGGVGIWANRVAKHFDAYTIGTVGNPGKLELLEKEGYDKGIVRSKNFRKDLKNALGERELNIVMECIGGQIFMDSYLNLTEEGRMIVYGAAQYAQPGKKPNPLKLIRQYLRRPKLDPQKMIDQNRGVIGFNLIYLFKQSDRMGKYLSDLEKMDLGKPVVGHSFEFKDLHKALELFRSGKTTGKVVVNV